MTFAALGSLLATTLVCEVPFLAAAFQFTSVELSEYLVAVALAFCVIPSPICSPVLPIAAPFASSSVFVTGPTTPTWHVALNPLSVVTVTVVQP